MCVVVCLCVGSYAPLFVSSFGCLFVCVSVSCDAVFVIVCLFRLACFVCLFDGLVD